MSAKPLGLACDCFRCSSLYNTNSAHSCLLFELGPPYGGPATEHDVMWEMSNAYVCYWWRPRYVQFTEMKWKTSTSECQVFVNEQAGRFPFK